MTDSLFLLWRGAVHGWRRCWRGQTRAGVGVGVLGIALLLEFFFLGWVMIGAVEQGMRSAPGFTVQISPRAADARIQELYAALQQSPSVQAVEYITKEQAYETERRSNPDLTAFLDRYNVSNPFPETFHVTLRSIADTAAFSAMISDAQWRDTVDAGSFSQLDQQTNSLEGTLGALRVGSLFLLGLCAVAFISLFTFSLSRIWRRAAGSDEVLLGWSVGASIAAVLSSLILEEMLLLVPCFIIAALVIAAFLLSPGFGAGLPTFLSTLPLPSALATVEILALLTLFACAVLATAAAWMLWASRGRLLRHCALS